MIQAVQRQRSEAATFTFEGFPLGLNTAVPPSMLSPKELPVCINFRFGPQGQLIDRQAIIKLTTGTAMTGDPVSMATAVISGTRRDIIACSDYTIYYLNGTVPTLIGTVTGKPYLIPFDDACLICDGSRLKYLDSVTAIKMSYDSGAAQHDNYNGVNNGGLALWSGANTRAGIKFTTPTWDVGYTMPLTQVEYFLKRTGSPTGTITVKLRSVTDDSILASKIGGLAEEISDSGEYVSVTFTAADVTTEMSRQTEYYASIEFSGGNSSNYIELRCTVEAGPAYRYGGSWVADAAKNPIIKIYPDVPPKTAFGVVSNRRPWLAGDPDNKGDIWYGYYSFKDFSTTGGGGYLSVIDDNSNSFEVGALQDLYGQLFVYGTEAQPYVSRLTGTTPGTFALPLTFQQAWATQRTLINTKNDLWNGSVQGVTALSGVQAYGDFRFATLSESIEDRFSYWRTEDAFAGYYPDNALYFLHMPLSGKTLIGHTRNGVTDTASGRVRYPWSEFFFPVTPTDFGQLSGGFTIGADDGHLYGFSTDTHLDLETTQVDSCFYTPKIQFPFNMVRVNKMQYVMNCVSGATFKIDIFTDGDDDNYIQRIDAGTLGALLDDATMLLTDATTLLSGSAYAQRNSINFTCHTIQLKFHTIVKVVADEVYFNGCYLRYQQTNKA